MITRERILLVDSQEHWVAVARGILVDAGFVVEAASTLTHAQDRIDMAREPYSLILVALGSAEEDRDAFRRLAFTGRGTKRPVVVLFPVQLTPTGMSEIFWLGAFACVDKPYGRRGLLKVIREETADYRAKFPPHMEKGNERVAAKAASVDDAPGEVDIPNCGWGLKLAALTS